MSRSDWRVGSPKGCQPSLATRVRPETFTPNPFGAAGFAPQYNQLMAYTTERFSAAMPGQ